MDWNGDKSDSRPEFYRLIRKFLNRKYNNAILAPMQPGCRVIKPMRQLLVDPDAGRTCLGHMRLL
jgi:hypothetical protein